jgi:ABC-type ATPase involved in cell division
VFVIRLEGVKLSRGGASALDHVTLAAAGGEIVVVTGPRGAGKSSLLAVAAAALRPQAGAVWVGARNIVELQASSLPYVRQNVGYLPPDPPFVRDETALTNVALALAVRGLPPSSAEREARERLEELGVGACASRAVASLSTPERQLVAVARALAGPPPVLVLDEPSAGLDADDRARLWGALSRIRDVGTAVLCGTSDAAVILALEDLGARVVRLEQGRVLTGAPTMSLVGGSTTAPPREARRR